MPLADTTSRRKRALQAIPRTSLGSLVQPVGEHAIHRVVHRPGSGVVAGIEAR